MLILFYIVATILTVFGFLGVFLVEGYDRVIAYIFITTGFLTFVILHLGMKLLER